MPEMLVDAVTESLAEQLRDYLANGLDACVAPGGEGVCVPSHSALTQPSPCRRLTQPLATSLTHSLVPVILPVAEEMMGHLTTELLTPPLTHTLSRSLAQSVVPALAYTVSHNPLQDYYCFYCFKHKAYCQYCHFSPSQVYYAQYYASYYAPYYGAFYEEEFAKLLSKGEEFGFKTKVRTDEDGGAQENPL